MPTIYIEESRTPIYRRIAYALGSQLARSGMDVLIVKPEGFNSSTFLQFVTQQGAAAYISNAGSNIIQSKLPGKDEYFFERFPGKLIFLHQDTILGGISLLSAIAKLQAWIRVAERSAHLCIEPDNVADLAAVGITHVKLVSHATEINPTEPCVTDFQYGTIFVGHAVPSFYSPLKEHSHSIQSLIDELIKNRRLDFSSPIQGQIKGYAEKTLDGIGESDEQRIIKIALSEWLRNEITGRTMPLRGWVFENCDIQPLTIFGGDPAYLHGVTRNLEVHRSGVNYEPPLYETEKVQRVFNKSKSNINISSLQFDHAVVNRFHDVVMSGGLCLTDARSGLAELTSAHEEVSFRTLDELRDRADYFSRQENARERSLLIKKIQADIAGNSGYPLLAQSIIAAINEI